MTTKFGWCLDGRHAQCKARLSYFRAFVETVLTCGCSCHNTEAGEPTYGD